MSTNVSLRTHRYMYEGIYHTIYHKGLGYATFLQWNINIMQQMSMSVKPIQRDAELGTLPNYIFVTFITKVHLHICTHAHICIYAYKQGRINIKVSQYHPGVPGLE